MGRIHKPQIRVQALRKSNQSDLLVRLARKRASYFNILRDLEMIRIQTKKNSRGHLLMVIYAYKNALKYDIHTRSKYYRRKELDSACMHI